MRAEGCLWKYPLASSRLTSTANRSAARTDIALLVCALFLQRFILPFPGGKAVALSIVPAAVIFVHQFFSGQLLIRYDRLLWYLLLTLAVTLSLLLNFSKSSLTSYSLFLVIYFLFMLSRPSTTDQYKRTLGGFQFLMLIISCLAIAQFAAQFVIDGTKLIMFYFMFPTSVLPLPPIFGPAATGGANTIIPLFTGSSLIKSNGIFLAEPSTMSQLAALAILIEILVFRRSRYLMILTLGLLLAYSGTGILILFVSLPLAVLVNRRTQLPVLLVSIFAIGLLAIGIIHLSVFTSRVDEFQNTDASGFIRFVSPFWMAADYLHRTSLGELLSGKGPGYGDLHGVLFYTASSDTWFKLFLEYGLFGAFIFMLFLGSCFRRSRCPTPLMVGLLYNYLFSGNSLLDPTFLIIMVVLCTLHGPESRRGHINEIWLTPIVPHCWTRDGLM